MNLDERDLKKIKSLHVMLKMPIWILEKETKKSEDQMLYEGLMKEVSGIKDIFSIIIDIVDKDIAMQKTSINTRLQFNNGIADELTKLVKLKESGYLSEEEFNIQKTKLLNR